jgi:hypothetical protein
LLPAHLELRRCTHAGLNKGEARNALARAVFFNRLGELRDRTYESQQHRPDGLNCKRRASLTLSSERQRELQGRSLGDGEDELS